MFVITLRFIDKSQAPTWMSGHNTWLAQGFEEGAFLLAGGLEGGAGGIIVAHGLARDELEVRLAADPFVMHGVVETDVQQLALGRTDPRLAFLKTQDA